MKKLLLLSIALLAAVPGLQADRAKCNTCSSSKKHVAKKACTTCVNAKVCKACKSHGKEECSCKHPANCKCSSKSKGGPVRRTLRATEEAVEGAGKVVVAPFEALFGHNDHKKKSHHKKNHHSKHHGVKHYNDKVNIDQLEFDNYAESNDNF